MPRYASQTEVSEGRSQQEIERTLTRYGAQGFMYGWNGNDAVIGFIASGRQVKIEVSMPSLEEASLTPSGRRRTAMKARLAAHGQARRQRWRALALVIKAKLEAVESGITSFEQEFLAWTMLPGGKTVGQTILPQIDEAYETGRLPRLLPGPSDEGP